MKSFPINDKAAQISDTDLPFCVSKCNLAISDLVYMFWSIIILELNIQDFELYFCLDYATRPYSGNIWCPRRCY